MNKLRSLLLVCVLLTLPLSACAGLGAALHAVDSAVNDSSQALNVIQTTFNVYQASHPVSPEQRALFDKLLMSALLTLRTGSAAVAPLHDLDQKQYDAAFKDFRVAYAALRNYLVVQGITPGSVGLVGAGRTSDDFPEPAVLGLHVQ
jgi:hypothetical protein